MKGKYFNWSRFPLRFLKAVLSSEATPIYARPDKFIDDADCNSSAVLHII